MNSSDDDKDQDHRNLNSDEDIMMGGLIERPEKHEDNDILMGGII